MGVVWLFHLLKKGNYNLCSLSMDVVICEKQECDACALSFHHIPWQENILIVSFFLDNSDILNSVATW